VQTDLLPATTRSDMQEEHYDQNDAQTKHTRPYSQNKLGCRRAAQISLQYPSLRRVQRISLVVLSDLQDFPPRR